MEEKIEQENKLQVIANETPAQPAFANKTSFEHAQRVARMLSQSSLVPDSFRGDANIQNAIIALEMANRIGASPLMVMQNLYIVKGKPSWSSSFIIAAINSSKRFTTLRFKLEGEGDSRSCYAYAEDAKSGERIEGTKITMKMVKEEGWGAKWKTMPDQMFCYRAAAFFGRLYAPDILMGMQTIEEVQDVFEADDTKRNEAVKVASEVAAKVNSITAAKPKEPAPAPEVKEEVKEENPNPNPKLF
jgi:hypothetical protein